MGMYRRYNDRITELEKYKRDLYVELAGTVYDDEAENIMVEIAEIDQEIGECEGALMELAEMDGYSSIDYGEWCDTF